MDWAELATLDLSKFDAPGGKEDLAKQLFNAIQQIGMYSLAPEGSILLTNFRYRILLYRKLRA